MIIKTVVKKLIVLPGLLLCSIFGLSACTSQYFSSVVKSSAQKVALTERYTVSRNYEWVIHPYDSIYLSSAVDTQKPDRTRHIYQFNLAMHKAVSQFFPNSTTSEQQQTIKDALRSARVAGNAFLFFPRLGAVEDNLNTREELADGLRVNPDGEFGPDNALFQVHIYEVRTGKLLDVSTVKARGKLFADKNTVPTDLFSEGAQAFVHQLQLASSEK